ncbi:MAG: NAD(P)H-dependent oxidoreductase [Ferruginibacter sp.]
MLKKQISILGISGSLKSTSSNTNIIRFISAIAPVHVSIKLFEGLDALPHFNPETMEIIKEVENLRQQIKDADAVIFSTPEYAFGVPGVLKNALDWLVSSGELNEKTVAAISASPLYSGGDKALASLMLTLTALGTNMAANASLSIANIKNKINEAGIVTEVESVSALQLLLENLISRVKDEE